ncbi:MAG: response regulator, partial [Promethearchaeota archaeon]
NKVKNNNFDIVLLDISLPGRNGLDVLKQLKSIKPDLPVLILSMYPEEQYAIRSLRAKASGYLTKESASDELIKAIRKVAQGRKYITSSLAEKLAFELEDSSGGSSSHEILSDREYQIMCMIASGKRIKEIADALSLSVKTISTYRIRILKKMNMKNTSQLIHYAIKSGLVD